MALLMALPAWAGQLTLRGKIVDAVTSQPVAAARIKVVGTDNASYEVQTDENGGFNVQLPSGSKGTLSIQVDQTDYLVAKDQISTLELEQSTSFVKEVALHRAAAGTHIRLAGGEKGLERLVAMMQANPTIVVELQAHTDHRGGATLMGAKKRLVALGIAASRVQVSGSGQSEEVSGTKSGFTKVTIVNR
jgi:outer membrane protein OmpA-like peptidoglycan-associated protein